MVKNDVLQRMQAMDVTQSFIVQAPAGSGKTELLIQRLLALLSTVNSPEEILAITFTKKAANEMRERVYHALLQAMQNEPDEPHKQNTWRLAKKVLESDKKHAWHLLQNPNQLKIQTIDSLCTHFTSQLPLLSHFGAQPTLSDNPDYLYKEAVNEVLAHLEENQSWSDSIGRLLLYLDNDLNKLHTLLVNLLKRRDQWLPHILSLHDNSSIKQILEEAIYQIAAEQIKLLETLTPPMLKSEMDALYRYASSNLNRNDDDTDEVNTWSNLSSLLLIDKGTWRKKASADIGFPSKESLKTNLEKAAQAEFKSRFLSLSDSLENHEHFRIALYEFKKLPALDIPDEEVGILVDLIVILKICCGQLRLTFQRYGKIDFTENALAAVYALGTEDNPTDLALSLDYKIQHVLVDEFQDTSSTQFLLLQKLTYGWESGDGRTLFVVGDPMQSIYRFREAEVGLFIRMRENGIGNLTLIPITLTHNFRSYQGIVDWNNQLFKSIFPAFSNIATGAVTYSESISTRQCDSHSPVEIRCEGFITTDERKEGLYIAQSINKIKNNHPDERIAILVRSRTHLTSILPELKALNIPYKAIDIDLLSSKQAILDLFALTSALLHPYDRIAWLSLLRAPWCGLLLSDLLIISSDPSNQPIIEQLSNQALLNKLSRDGYERVEKLKIILSNTLTNRHRSSIQHAVLSTWTFLGGPACVEADDLNDVYSYFELLERFSGDGETLHLDNLKEAIKKLYASTELDDNAIQIMTIHSAKGLEFDTVILPHLEKKTPHDEKKLLAWIEQPLKSNDIALLISPMARKSKGKKSLYDYITRQQRLKLEHETDRLLYVATTRAKKRLYLSFTSNDNEFKNISGSFLDKILPTIKNQVNLHIDDAETKTTKGEILRHLSRLPAEWKNPILFPALEKAAIHQRYEGFYLQQQIAKQLGNAVHSILEQIGIHGLLWWKEKITDHTSYIMRMLKSNAMPHQFITPSTDAISAMIQNTLNDDRGKWIFQKHLHAQSEYSITSVINKEIGQIIIDRTFIDEQGTRWIIDFKTAAPDNLQSLADFAESEKSKYQAQMDKYKNAFSSIEKNNIKFGLYFPAIPYWIEWV